MTIPMLATATTTAVLRLRCSPSRTEAQDETAAGRLARQRLTCPEQSSEYRTREQQRSGIRQRETLETEEGTRQGDEAHEPPAEHGEAMFCATKHGPHAYVPQVERRE